MIDLIQWPAMATTLLAAWLVGAKSSTKRNHGFWVFLLSNVLWIAWGVSTASWALVILQVGLAVMNTRGARKTEDIEASENA